MNSDALSGLADIVVPAPISMAPTTWGWAVLGIVVCTGLVVLLIFGLRSYFRNHYRRQALAELSAIAERIESDEKRRDAVLLIPPLLKRTALAATSSATLPGLSGPPWIAFLQASAPPHVIEGPAAYYLAEGEYRSGAAPALHEARQLSHAARAWIEGHHVRT